jgi:hypothetical protein
MIEVPLEVTDCGIKDVLREVPIALALRRFPLAVRSICDDVDAHLALSAEAIAICAPDLGAHPVSVTAEILEQVLREGIPGRRIAVSHRRTQLSCAGRISRL